MTGQRIYIPPTRKKGEIFCTRDISDKENYQTIEYMVENANNLESTQYRITEHTRKVEIDFGPMSLEDRVERLNEFVKKFGFENKIKIKIFKGKVRMIAIMKLVESYSA